MKVENQAEYLEVEKIWKKIHEERLKENKIIGWVVYKVMFKTAEDPHNFVTLTMYNAFSKLDKGIPDKILKAAYPEKSEDDWKAFYDRTYKSRKVITSSIFYQQLSCAKGPDRFSKFYMINEINVKPDKSMEYIKIEEEIYKPLYEEAIRNSNRTAWSLWEKWQGNMKDFQYGLAGTFEQKGTVMDLN
jgi:hypothetical protein